MISFLEYILCHSNREDFGGDPWQRFLCNPAERDGAVKGDGRGVLQRAQRETFLQPAGGIHVSVSLSADTAKREGQSDHSRPALFPATTASFSSTFNCNLSSLESRQPQARGEGLHLNFILCSTAHV